MDDKNNSSVPAVVAYLAEAKHNGKVGAHQLYFNHDDAAGFCAAAITDGGYPETEITPLVRATQPAEPVSREARYLLTNALPVLKREYRSLAVEVEAYLSQPAEPAQDEVQKQRTIREGFAALSTYQEAAQGVGLTEEQLRQIIRQQTNPIAAAKYDDTFVRIAKAVQGAILARQSAPTQAPPAPQAMNWQVRERRAPDGELLDCFVEAPREGKMAYGLEVLGDDYEGYGGVDRKLEHCKLIVSRVNAAPTLDSAPQGELIELLKAIRPKYGDVGSRDVDVAAQQKRIDRAIELLSVAAPQQPAAEQSEKEAVALRWNEALTQCAELLGMQIGESLSAVPERLAEQLTSRAAVPEDRELVKLASEHGIRSQSNQRLMNFAYALFAAAQQTSAQEGGAA